ncbi:MAG: hypothetical protein ACT4NL_03175 [Pseudomarimonas sp.]
MAAIVSQLLELCLLRRAPQDLPYSPALARGLIVAGVGIDLLYTTLIDFPQALPRIFLSLVLLLLMPWLLLGLRDRRSRYVQTLTALAGAGLVLSAVSLPMALFFADLPAFVPGTKPTPQQALFSLITLTMLSWKLVIGGHIFRHALDWPRLPAMLLVFGLFLFELGLDSILIGNAA